MCPFWQDARGNSARRTKKTKALIFIGKGKSGFQTGGAGASIAGPGVKGKKRRQQVPEPASTANRGTRGDEMHGP